MLQINNPLTLFKLRYKSASGRTDKVSESQAKYQLDHILQQKHPAMKRLLITERHTPGQEYLLINPELAAQMDKAGIVPPQGLPQLDADSFKNTDYEHCYQSAREITVRHRNGQVTNSADIQKSINPFLDVLKNPKIQKRIDAQKKLEEKGQKAEAQSSKAKSIKMNSDTDWTSDSESDEELMFTMDL